MRPTSFLVFFGACLALLVAQGALAQSTTTIPKDQPTLLKGVRQLGMGNAGVAMPAQDGHAPFYNPAAINDYEQKLHFEFLEIGGDLSTGAISLAKDVINLVGDINDAAATQDKVDVFRTFVNQHIGDFESVQIRLPVLQVQHKWFHATILADSRSTISFRNRSFTNFELFSHSDFGGVIGGAWSFFPDESIEHDILQVGANLKILHRLSIDEVLTTDDVINNADFDAALPRRRATGVGADIGLKVHLPTFGWGFMDFLRPTLGLAYQDIGNAPNFSDPIQDNQQSLTVGFALHPTFGSPELPFKAHFAFDVRGVNQKRDFTNKLNLGAELEFPQFWNFFTPSVRLGGNQLYFTGGVTLDFKYAKLEYASYGEEMGKFTRQQESRRHTFSLGFDI